MSSLRDDNINFFSFVTTAVTTTSCIFLGMNEKIDCYNRAGASVYLVIISVYTATAVATAVGAASCIFLGIHC